MLQVEVDQYLKISYILTLFDLQLLKWWLFFLRPMRLYSFIQLNVKCMEIELSMKTLVNFLVLKHTNK
jgi:hypothetical protein